ncbi:MAG: hypothetical protein NUV67_03070 [archaeon]|nr:hypothetical protein [archaeon]
MVSAKSTRKATRKARVLTSGFDKGYLPIVVSPREWALRRFGELGFDFKRAESDLRSRIDSHRKQAREYQSEMSFASAAHERQFMAADIQALKELQFLKSKGTDFWLHRAMNLFHRDLRAKVRANPNKKISVEETAALILDLNGIVQKGDMRGLVIGVTGGGRDFSNRHLVLDGALKIAIGLASSHVSSIRDLVELGKRHKASAKAIAEIEAVQREDQELLDFLLRLNKMPAQIRYERIEALRNRDFTKKTPQFKPPFELE